METIERIEIGPANMYKTLEDDPQYFGAYLNMARHNVFSISNYVAAQMNLPKLKEEAEIRNSFLCNKNNKKLNWNYAFSKVRRFLPILNVFDFESLPKIERESEPGKPNTGKNFALMSDCLKCLFAEIQEFRNDYSHYYSITNGLARKTTVSDNLAEFLKTNFQRAIEYSKQRLKGGVSNEDFEHVKTRVLVNQDLTITVDGFVFLIAMFLEREHAFQFIGKIKGLKGTQFNSFIATREVFMTFCAKLPNDKLVSEDKKQAFTLDIINNLNRCPKELYAVITEGERQRFQSQFEALRVDNLIQNSSNGRCEIEDYQAYVEALTRKVRHGNRFSYFALRYIDEENIFSKLRFQINLGKLLIDEYEKPIDTEMYPRTIVENVKAFGKLSDFENESAILSQIDKEGMSLGFEQFAPSYNIKNNKIALHTNKANARVIHKPNSDAKIKTNLKQALPEAFLSLHELPKIILLEYLSKGKSEELINDFILANNSKITNKQFIEEVKRKLPDDWNAFRKRTDSKKGPAYNAKTLDYLNRRKAILNGILDEYKLNHKQIPSRILNYWLNIVDVNTDRAFSDRIKRIKREGMDRLRAYRKFKAQGAGKIPKIGEMATYLARDIVDMIVSKPKKKKITSFYYDKMQACLALYADPDKKRMFIDIVYKELKLNGIGGHPFLSKIPLKDLNYTHDLYEQYLMLKFRKNPHNDESWLNDTFFNCQWDCDAKKKMTSVSMPFNKTKVPFSIRQLETNSTFDEWLQDITQGNVCKKGQEGRKPVNLPTNLFDDTLIALLQQELDAQNVVYSTDAKYNELFKLWWKNRGDGSQDFYKAEREYLIYDERVNFKLKENAKFADFFTDSLVRAFKVKQAKRKIEKSTDRRLPDIQFSQVEKVFKRIISNTEKQIRLIQEEDQMQLLMLDRLMGDGVNLNLKLNEIHTLLNDTIWVKQSIAGKLSFGPDGQNLTNNENPVISKIIVDQRKRKDHSMLQKYAYDRRLPELFEYFSENEIPLPKLKNELNAYNNAKQLVLNAAFKLEETLISNPLCAKEIINQLDKDFDPIQHKPYLLWLKKQGVINEDAFTFLNMIRNCFSHNQFPQKRTMGLLVNQWRSDNFALQIAELYNEKIDAIIAELKKKHPFFRS